MRRIVELDSLRGLAALGVVFFHAFPDSFFIGWSCVDLFFVLSGFLITTIILENSSEPHFLPTFYLRRIIRIWPVYYAALVAVLIFNSLSKTGFRTDGLIWHLLFIQNVQGYWGVAPPEFIYSFSPSWSVALEEQFYLVWPVLLFMFGRRGIAPIAIVLIVASIATRWIGLPVNLLLTRFDGLAIGSLLAVVLGDQRLTSSRVRLRTITMVFAGSGLLSFGFILRYLWVFFADPSPQWTTVSYTCFALFYASIIGLLYCYSGNRFLKPLRIGPLVYLGTISYGMYLYHLPIVVFTPIVLSRLGIGSVLPNTMIVWIMIFLVPAVSYHCLEKPFLSFRSLLRYRNSTIAGCHTPHPAHQPARDNASCRPVNASGR